MEPVATKEDAPMLQSLATTTFVLSTGHLNKMLVKAVHQYQGHPSLEAFWAHHMYLMRLDIQIQQL